MGDGSAGASPSQGGDLSGIFQDSYDSPGWKLLSKKLLISGRLILRVAV
jgi:hypothetical protein